MGAAGGQKKQGTRQSAQRGEGGGSEHPGCRRDAEGEQTRSGGDGGRSEADQKRSGAKREKFDEVGKRGAEPKHGGGGGGDRDQENSLGRQRTTACMSRPRAQGRPGRRKTVHRRAYATQQETQGAKNGEATEAKPDGRVLRRRKSATTRQKSGVAP